MSKQYGKRILSFVMAMIMVLSLMPAQVLAEEGHDHENEEITASSNDQTLTESGESEALIALRAEIAAHVEALGITPDMPDVYLLYAYGNHGSYEEAQASVAKVDELEQKAALLSKEEQKTLAKEENTKLLQRYREAVQKAYSAELMANNSYTVGQLQISNNGGNLTNNNGTFTATAQSTSKEGCTGGVTWTTVPMYIYIKNTSDVEGLVSFNMEQTTINSIVAGSDNLQGKGSYSKTLKAGEEFAITINTGENTNVNKLVLKDITFTAATQAFTVSVEYPNALGSVTASVEGTSEEVEGITTLTIPDITAAEGVTLTATSDTFLCWVDQNNKLLSKDKVFTVKPSADTTIKAVMTAGKAYFQANGLVYSDLNEAAQNAASGSNKVVALLNNGTLEAGTYTIPSGVTLLIPYDDINTLCTAEPTKCTDTYSIPKVYRTLTMAEGAHIVVNGAMSLSAKITGSGANSSPVGNCSFVQMQSGSSITVNNGGKLYAWGYIQGSGAVTVEKGGTVYECFQVRDWPGGDNATGLIDNSRRVFLMSQYYIQNIEVPLTLKAGAIENGYMAVHMSGQLIGSGVPFIGPNGMFEITDGYIVKDYDESTGRLLIDTYGDFRVKSMSITLTVHLVVDIPYTVDSSKYVLPINGNMTINMHSGSVTMTQDIALLPGARLIIGEDANCSLAKGNKIYVYDYDEWVTREDTDTATGEGPSFCGTADQTHVNLSFPASAAKVAGRTDDAYVEVNGSADLSQGYVYTTAGGALVCGSGTIIMQPNTDTNTYQFKLLKDSAGEEKKKEFFAIPITSAKLTNADGTVVETSGITGKVIYENVNGNWTCEHTYAEGTYTEKVTTAATCLASGVKTITCNCGHVVTEEIPQLNHEYEAVVTNPTCTAAGFTTHTCKNGCNQSYTDTPVAAKGHDYKAVVTAPTCTEDGYTTHTCATCNDSYKDTPVAALGHSYKSAVTAPTCTAEGYTTHTCATCNDSYKDTPVAALGHTEVVDKAVAPTCTETGLTEGKHCSVCNTVTVAQEEVPALGHSYNSVVTAPTCTDEGYTTYTCSVCDDSYVSDKVAALGHSYEDVVTAPTCTAEGYTTYTCSACGDSYVSDNVAAKGHKWEWVTDKEATVLESGIKHEECSVCHAKQNENTEIPVLKCSHDGTMTATEAKAATCTEAGNSAYWYCSACRNYYSDAAGQHEIEKDSWIIAAKGHTAGAEATCTTAQTCTVCGVVLKDALGHTMKHNNPVAATCENRGKEEYWFCDTCKKYFSDAEGLNEIEKDSWIIPELDHDYTVTTVYPSGTTKGFSKYVCSRFGCEDEYTTKNLDANAYVDKTLVAFGDSITAGVGVTKDENDYVKLLADKLGMSYVRKGFSGTSLATGGSRICNIENFTAVNLAGADVVTILMGINDFVAAKDGKYELGDINSTDTSTIYGAVKKWCEEIVKLKTESLKDTQFYFVTPVITSWKNETVRDWDQSKTNDNGYTLRDLCNAIIEVAATYKIAVIDLNLLSGLYYVDAQDNNVDVFGGDGAHPGATGHAMMADALAKALLQSDCDAKCEHNYGSWITTTWASCLNGEQQMKVCSECGKVEAGVKGEAKGHTAGAEATCTTAQTCTVCGVVLKDALGHDEVAHEAKAPTCTETGWDAYVTCSRCDYSTKGEALPADPEAHVWGEGVSDGLHSCNAPSHLVYTCKLCKQEYKVVEKEQHFRVPIATEIPATCTEGGMTSGWKCEKCDEFWIPQEVIPATGHDWNGVYPCQNEKSECSRCDEKFKTQQEHDVIVDAAVAATCTTTGLTEGSHCGYCGETLVAQEVTPMKDHNWITDDMETPATCNSIGHKAGATYCVDCDYDADPIPMLTHKWMHRDAKKATYSAIGWNAHDYCLLCNAVKSLDEYESKPCEYCGENPEGYIEIPMVPIQPNTTYEELVTNLYYLELMAEQYAQQNPGTDPLGLVLNYMRTGVANYTSGSWAIMAGAENKDFLKFVQEAEDTINSNPDIDVFVNVSGLKKLGVYPYTYGEINEYNKREVQILTGHFFGTMDMTYYNKGSQNHADVGGWVGDLTDLLSTSDEFGVPANLTLEEKVAYIREHYLFKENVAGSAGSFGSSDLYADLEGYYFMNELITNGYEPGDLEKMITEYFQSGLTLEKRVSYLLDNRLDGLSTRKDLRTAVYNAYTSNKLISTLEGTRNFNASGNELAELRKAVCYAFADEMCRIAGDYVEDLTNPRFTVFDTETKILAPGVSQQINYATNADGNQIVYYIATADVARDDVGLWVNYYDRDPGTPENPQWKNNSVPSSAQNAQNRYGDPKSPDYIENFNVIASTNAGGYDMSDVATPGGLMVMNGVEWHPQSGTAGFFAILSDGTAYMGTHDEYKGMMAEGRIQEAIGGFGEFVVKDGKVVGSAAKSDAPRTSVGITATGRVVLMCIDGRQAPFSSGASLQDVGYIMKEAGCVIAINLDGGGSTTFVARQPGDDELTVMNRPSDGYPRNVSTNLLIYSTAPSSTKFDHAVIESEYDYATIGTAVQMNAAGVSPAGNAVDIPEGATWAVSNDDWAFITEDGVFTGKRLGEVYVYLMLDGQVVGSKLMTLTNPDQLYFEKTKIDAIYGSSVKLPLRARVGGKGIAINANDVTFALSAPKAGAMDGFTFKAAESTIKTLTITAAINESTSASINVMLYQQGENSFDFENATGGDRTLAWYREVTNAKVEDGNIYNVIDPDKDMVTSYTFAMDMTAIPIPERLEELTYMLPGGTMEGANAWTFLTSLAQRISDLSWVKATIKFDERFDVDYSELTILNDYFKMDENGLVFDEATNTLTVTLHWIKQSQVIDEATANSLCLIKGIKLTPKDSAWDDVTKINAVMEGNIGYEIYMRASGLYSFAQKPESQAVFGIYPYRNPADTTDAGGYFHDTYAEITDEYTLVNVLKEGWVNEDGGFAYYVAGERLTGIQKVEGVYYDFGEMGINVGQTKFTGLFYDDAVDAYRYSKQGELANGWHEIGGAWHYFKKYVAVSGKVNVGGVYYDFEETGKLVSGKWVNTLDGVRYYYGPDYYWNGWYEIDGNLYRIDNGYRRTGYHYLGEPGATRINKWYNFGEDGIAVAIDDEVYEAPDGKIYNIVDGKTALGLYKIGDDYFFFDKGGVVAKGRFYVWETHCEYPCDSYYFDEEGRMITNGLAEIDGTTYYFRNGKAGQIGLIEIDGYYYFVGVDGVVAKGNTYVWRPNGIVAEGSYAFDENGRMLGIRKENGQTYRGEIAEMDGKLYYFNAGKAVKAGLVEVDDYYYFAGDYGEIATGTTYVWKTNGLVAEGTYEFDSEGRMLGIHMSEGQKNVGQVAEVNGELYYFVNGKATKAGLILVDGYYYFAGDYGKIATGNFYVWKPNGIVAESHYTFGEDGKMLGVRVENGQRICGEVVEVDGGLYYYSMGKATKAGLVLVDGYYYFAGDYGKIATGNYYVWKGNGIVADGSYEFGTDGKMLGVSVVNDVQVLGEIAEVNGGYCYYRMGRTYKAGLFELNGNYYFAGDYGKIATGSFYVWKPNGIVAEGTYRFAEDGRMLGVKIVEDTAVCGELVDIDGVRYYYSMGRAIAYGLVELNGNYYFAGDNGVIATERAYVWKTNGLLPENSYTFDETGRMLGIRVENGQTILGEIIEKDGATYVYSAGNTKAAGLIEIDGYYYFVGDNGLMATGVTYVWKPNGLLPEGNYTFDAEGRMIGIRIVDGIKILGEVVEIDGELYYYENGRGRAAGLIYRDGYYYFASDYGKLVVNQRYYIWKSNDLLLETTYTFDHTGRIVG